MKKHPHPRSSRRTAALILAGSIAALLVPRLSAQTTITYTNGQTDATAYDTSAPNDPTTLTLASGAATQSGIVSGNGAVIKTGTGTLTLSGLNNYSGGTVISNGTLNITALTGAGSGTITLGDAATGANNVTLTGTSGTGVTPMQNNIVVANQGSGMAILELAQGATWGGASIQLNRATTFQTNSAASYGAYFGKYDSTSVISGNVGTLTVQALSTGLAYVAGNNTFVGTVVLPQGNVETLGKNAFGGSGNSVIMSGTAGLQLSYPGLAIGALTGESGNTISAAGGSTLTISSASSATFAGVISGTGDIIKAGAGTQMFSGANTFTGATNVTAGTLELGNDLALQNSALTISGTGALAFSPGVTPTLGGLNGVSNLTLAASITTLPLNPASGVTASYSGALGSATPGMTLTKTGPGTQILSGTNTYTGATTVSAGVLLSANQGALSTTSSVAVNGTGTLAVNYGGASDYTQAQVGTLLGKTTFTGSTTAFGIDTTNAVGSVAYSSLSSLVPAAVGLNKLGAGTLILDQANTYTGTTTVTGGTLAEGSTGSIADTSNLIVNGARTIFDLGTNHSDTVGTVTLQGGSITGSGSSALTANAGQTFEMQSGSVSAILAGSGIALNKTTNGTVKLSGANTYTGATTISGGTLDAGTLELGNVNALQNSTLDVGAPFHGSPIAFTVAGTNTYNLGGLTGTRELYIDGNNTISVGANNASTTYSGHLGGGGLTKVGAGTLTLTGANFHSGNTTIHAGTLKLNLSGSISESANIVVGDAGSTGTHLDVTTKTGGLTIGLAQTLKGIGQIDGNTTILGTHAPGNSPGLQTFNGNLAYSTGSTLNWELAANVSTGTTGLRGTDFDGVDVIGAGVLTVGTGVTSNIIFNAAGSTVDLTGAFWNSNHSWLAYSDAVAPALSSAAIFDTVTVTTDSLGAMLAGGTFAWSEVGNDVVLNYTAAPEPGSAVLLTLGAGALVGWRPRRG